MGKPRRRGEKPSWAGLVSLSILAIRYTAVPNICCDVFEIQRSGDRETSKRWRMNPLTEEIDFQLAHHTERIHSDVIEHNPPLTMRDFRFPSVPSDLDDLHWHENNREAPGR